MSTVWVALARDFQCGTKLRDTYIFVGATKEGCEKALNNFFLDYAKEDDADPEMSKEDLKKFIDGNFEVEGPTEEFTVSV